ncbi:MAG: hypothetical protein PHV74_00270 [Dehalococcoidia bacterium]|nr:hypothetical protein [Dehalococcoidia bacterium]
MFHGSIPTSMQAILKGIVKNWDADEFYVGCSGSFTVERVLHSISPDFRLYSNDVTIYSNTLGQFFSGQPVEIDLNDLEFPMFSWLNDYMLEDVDRVATMLLATGFERGITKPNNRYYSRIIGEYQKQFPELHAKMKEKLQKLTLKLASYSAEDVYTWIDRVPDGKALVMYMPFFSGDYTNQFKKLGRLFFHTEPEFKEIDQDRKMEILGKAMRKDKWVLGIHLRMPEMEPYLKGVTQTTNRGVPIYVYSNAVERSQVVMPHQDCANVLIPRLSPGATVGEKMELKILDSPEFHSLRSQYMNENIKPGSESLAVGVLVDGYLIGVYAFSSAPSFGTFNGIPNPCIYLLSDFPVAPTDYKRLAKLVLYAAASSESQLLAERLARGRVRSIVTTAFSENPVSMKYRGLFNLLSRKETDEQGKKYMLNYWVKIGAWTLPEGLALWKKKHGQRLEVKGGNPDSQDQS